MSDNWREGYFAVIHFERKVSNFASHHKLWIPNRGVLPALLTHMRRGGGRSIMRVAHEQGIGFALVNLTPMPRDGLKSKRRQGDFAQRYCPVCRGEMTYTEARAWELEQFPSPPKTPGPNGMVVIAYSHRDIEQWCRWWGFNPHQVTRVTSVEDLRRLYGWDANKYPRPVVVLDLYRCHPLIRERLRQADLYNSFPIDYRILDEDLSLSKGDRRHAA